MAWWPSLARLTSRERVFLLGGGAVSLLLVVTVAVVLPLMDRWEILRRTIGREERAIAEIATLRGDFLRLRQQVREAEAQVAPGRGEPSILSYLEDLAATHGVRRNIAHMRPQANALDAQYSETVVEVRLEEMTLAQVVDFLAAIEQSPRPIRVKRLQLRTRFAEPRLMDMVVHVASYART